MFQTGKCSRHASPGTSRTRYQICIKSVPSALGCLLQCSLLSGNIRTIVYHTDSKIMVDDGDATLSMQKLSPSVNGINII